MTICNIDVIKASDGEEVRFYAKQKWNKKIIQVTLKKTMNFNS